MGLLKTELLDLQLCLIKSCENVEDLEKLSSSIVELGKEMVGDGKGRFMVAIDSVSEMLRFTSLTSVAVILSNLRSHDNVSCLFWLLHSDLHDNGITAALEYMSSMQASIEPMAHFVDEQRGNSWNLSWMEQNLRRGKFCVFQTQKWACQSDGITSHNVAQRS